MKTSSLKAKGRRCAAEVKDLLLAHEKSLESGDIMVASSGCTGEDLLLSPQAQAIFPFVVECKNQERLSIWQALDQAKSHQKREDHIPVLFFKRNRSELYVALPASKFLYHFSRGKR